MAKLAVLEERIKNLADQVEYSAKGRDRSLDRLERDMKDAIAAVSKEHADDMKQLAEKQTWLVRLVWLVVIAFASLPFFDLLDLVRVVK